MADREFEEFRQSFEKLPSHIKAPAPFYAWVSKGRLRRRLMISSFPQAGARCSRRRGLPHVFPKRPRNRLWYRTGNRRGLRRGGETALADVEQDVVAVGRGAKEEEAARNTQEQEM